MTATNHALTGAAIGLMVGNPYIAIPAALVSHLICDGIPHFGNPQMQYWRTPFRVMLATDAFLCFLLVCGLAWRHPIHWALAALCAFLATSPDFYWIKDFARAHRHHTQRDKPENVIDKVLGKEGIQWFQRPIGAVVEVAWAVAGLLILLPFLR